MDGAGLSVRKWVDWENKNEETRHLLQIFPQEIWIQIFNNISNPKALLNMAQASFLWKQLLNSRRTEYLFPQVLEALVTQNHLSHPSILECRKVCKSWRTSVNELLEKGPDVDKLKFGKFEYALHNDPPTPTYFGLYTHRKRELIEYDRLQAIGRSNEFCQQNNLLLYSPSPTNILPRRRLSIDDRNILYGCKYSNIHIKNIRKKYLADVNRTAKHFLETVGHHFWYARIGVKYLADAHNWHDFTCDQVTQLPNLKFLYIDFKHDDSDLLYRKGRKFPTLHNLELLSLDSVPISTLESIIKANSHIKMLILISVNNQDFKNCKWPALTSLHTLSVQFTQVTDHFHMPAFQGLKVLRLGFDADKKKENLMTFVDWSQIFFKLESYRGTLTELFLELPRAVIASHKEIIWSASKVLLNLPNVTKLELSVGDVCSFDFLLGLVSLECLLIRLEHDTPPSKEEDTIINFDHAYPHFTSECNIWRFLPRLSKVELTTRFDGNLAASTRTHFR